MLIGTSALVKLDTKAHFKSRQSSEMVQSPEVAVDKVWVLRLLSESHIWDRVTLGTQVGGSSGGDGKGEGEAVAGGPTYVRRGYQHWPAVLPNKDIIDA